MLGIQTKFAQGWWFITSNFAALARMQLPPGPDSLHARIFGLFAAVWIVPALLDPLLAGQIVENLS